jgi:hypothetical protein
MQINNISEVNFIMNNEHWQRLRWLIKASIVMTAILAYTVIAWHQHWRHPEELALGSPQVLQALVGLLGK